jgi:hypothetical protein
MVSKRFRHRENAPAGAQPHARSRHGARKSSSIRSSRPNRSIAAERSPRATASSAGPSSTCQSNRRARRRRRIISEPVERAASSNARCIGSACSGSTDRRLMCPCVGRRTAVGAEFAIAPVSSRSAIQRLAEPRDRTARLDEPHSPVAGSHSTVWPELPLSHGVSRGQGPQLPQNGNWPLQVRRFCVVQSGS